MSVRPRLACTPKRTRGASVAMTARRPHMSTKKPKNGEMQAEIRYGMETISAELVTALLNWVQYASGWYSWLAQYVPGLV